MTPGVSKAQTEQRQFKTLKDELAILSTKIEAAKKRLNNYQFDTEEHARLVKLLSDLNATKATLEPEVRALQACHKTLTDKVGDVDKKIAAKQLLISELDTKHADTKKTHATLTEEVRQLKIEKADLVSSKREELRKDLAGIEADKVEANKALKAVNQAVSKALKKSKALGPKAKKHDELTGAIKRAQIKLDGIESNITARTAAHKRADEAATALEAELDAKRKAFDEECHKWDVALKLKEKDLEEREGDANRVTQWNKKKAGLLRQAKMELEEIHGKPLRHIIIPPDEE